MERDFGLRFSDEYYATKDEVKATLNMSSIDNIWDKIIEYRSLYTKMTQLKDIERKNFSVVLVPKISARIISLEKKLTKLFVKLSKIEGTSQGDKIVQQCEYEILKIIANNYHIDISNEMLLSLINQSLSTVPPEYLVLVHYLKVNRYYLEHFSDPVSLNLILSMYAKLAEQEFNTEQIDTLFRKTDLIKPVDHVFVGKHYEAAPLDRIQDTMAQLVEFCNESALFSLVNATFVFFYLNYIKPFEYYNEEMSVLVFKYVLAHSDFDQLAYLLPFEEMISSDYLKRFESLMYESEMKLDMTYLLNWVLEFVESSIYHLSDKLVNLEVEQIKQENFMARKDETVEIPVVRNFVLPKYEGNVNSSNIALKEVINYERKVSLPTLPIGLDEKDVNIIKDHLLEIYPSLKPCQADFYAKHCTIGKYYSIGQYKKEENVAYETARTSMDNLALLGFYKKEKVGNKFVYTPVIRA